MHSRLLIITLAVLALASACEKNPVGRRCFVGALPDAGTAQSQIIIASPALECPSRTCLRQPLQRELPEGSEFDDLCTAECTSDSDCDRAPESPCEGGFICNIVTSTGPFCCRKMCVCRDYIATRDAGLEEPSACNPNNPANACVNLPGN